MVRSETFQLLGEFARGYAAIHLQLHQDGKQPLGAHEFVFITPI